jgi:hypothetical protein
VNEAYLKDSYTSAKTAIQSWFSKVQEKAENTQSNTISPSSN